MIKILSSQQTFIHTDTTNVANGFVSSTVFVAIMAASGALVVAAVFAMLVSFFVKAFNADKDASSVEKCGLDDTSTDVTITDTSATFYKNCHHDNAAAVAVVAKAEKRKRSRGRSRQRRPATAPAGKMAIRTPIVLRSILEDDTVVTGQQSLPFDPASATAANNFNGGNVSRIHGLKAASSTGGHPSFLHLPSRQRSASVMSSSSEQTRYSGASASKKSLRVISVGRFQSRDDSETATAGVTRANSARFSVASLRPWASKNEEDSVRSEKSTMEEPRDYSKRV